MAQRNVAASGTTANRAISLRTTQWSVGSHLAASLLTAGYWSLTASVRLPAFQRFFQLYTSRSFEQHHIPFSCFASQPLACFFRSRNKQRLGSSFAGAVHDLLSQSAHPEQNVDLLFASMPATCLMQFFRQRPEFEHLSRDHDSPLRIHRCQRVDHRVQRLRIRIVAIVHHRDVTQLENLPAFVGRSERCQRPYRFRRLHPTGKSHRHGSQRVQDVVFANEWKNRMRARFASDHVELRTLSPARDNVFAANFGPALNAVLDYSAFEVAAELRNIFIICIQYRGAV